MSMQNTLAIATDGYLAPSPFTTLAMATSGYILPVIVQEAVPGGGPSGPERLEEIYERHGFDLERLLREDEEMATIIILATIYGIIR